MRLPRPPTAPTPSRGSLPLIFEDIEADYRINNKGSGGTLKCLLEHLRRAFAIMRAVDMTTDKVRTYVLERQEEGAANSTINRELAALKQMFNLQIQAGRLSRKPHIQMLEENNVGQGFLDHASFLTLREKLPDGYADPVAFLYYSGWRIGEMRSLELRDVDIAGRMIRLRPELAKNKEGRLLPLTGDLLAVIERAVAHRRLDCPFVFHIDGHYIGDFRKAWYTAWRRRGLGPLAAHRDADAERQA